MLRWWRDRRRGREQVNEAAAEEAAAYWKQFKAQTDRESPEEQLKREIIERRLMGQRHPQDPRP
jgi:hypothetical protein